MSGAEPTIPGAEPAIPGFARRQPDRPQLAGAGSALEPPGKRVRKSSNKVWAFGRSRLAASRSLC
ncbi:hypothetical protein A1355_23950 [Methylomonas koyamae]|uniref:Uncharacterized protein n=1 Tax=Methylomonas koyamae TaxID=702114 RepID=A0A177NRB0_9GAMM|nr:hypothetical protein A1355_23950 [Methylomonas koyamae]